jgi:hypothetical protein
VKEIKPIVSLVKLTESIHQLVVVPQDIMKTDVLVKLAHTLV